MLPKVLFVDPDALRLSELTHGLRKDYSVDTVKGAAEALVHIRDIRPAVVVSEAALPDGSGILLLQQIMTMWPEITRMMLVSRPSTHVATEAINRAQVFRLLTKPCSPSEISTSLEEAVTRQRLVHAERSLLVDTLTGCIDALTELVAMVNPVVFGRTMRLKRLATAFADSLECRKFWQLHAAASLCQLGLLSLPPPLVQKLYYGEPLIPEETALVSGLPERTVSLLGHIAGLDPVVQILTALNWPDERVAKLGEGTVGLGARILGLVIEYDTLITQGHATGIVLQTLRRRSVRFGTKLIEQFAAHLNAAPATGEIRELPLRSAQAGMLIMEDIRTEQGTLLVPRGFEVTPHFMERMQNCFPDLIERTVRVLVETNDGCGVKQGA